MALRVTNDYSDIGVDWFLGDEGDIDSWVQPHTAIQDEFDPQLARLFLEYLQFGMTERQACLEVPMEERRLRSWKRGFRGAPNSFIVAYERAAEQQVHCMADDIIDIADGTDRLTAKHAEEAIKGINNPFRKPIESTVERGVEALKKEMAAKGERIASRKWYVGKKLPSNYGDRVQLDHGGSKTPVNVKFSELTDEQLEKLADIDKELGSGDGS